MPGVLTVGSLTLHEARFVAQLVEGLPGEAELRGTVRFQDLILVLVQTGMFDEETASLRWSQRRRASRPLQG